MKNSFCLSLLLLGISTACELQANGFKDDPYRPDWESIHDRCHTTQTVHNETDGPVQYFYKRWRSREDTQLIRRSRTVMPGKSATIRYYTVEKLRTKSLQPRRAKAARKSG